MAKKILKIVLEVIIVLIAYLLQFYIVNSTTLFGIKGDLCLMVIVVITLIHKNITAYTVAIMCGIMSDMLFFEIPLKHLVIYLLVVSVIIGMKKIYKQDSKMSIIVFSSIATLSVEILRYLFNVLSKGEFVNIFSFILMIIKEGILNIFFALIMYLILNICKQEG